MTIQTTASRTGLLLQCPRPFEEETETDSDSPGEPARYGSAFHEALELVVQNREVDLDAILAKWDFKPELAAELCTHLEKAQKTILAYCEGHNPWDAKYDITATETSSAFRDNGKRLRVRPVTLEPLGHHYDLAPREIGGTFDLLLTARGAGIPTRVVVDYKTGEWGDFTDPGSMPQMLTLAILTGADAVAILHTPRVGPAVMWSAIVDDTMVANFRKRLRIARRRIGSGFIREGAECKYCPARGDCPTQVGDALARTEKLGLRVMGAGTEMVETNDPGRVHMLLAEVEKLAHRMKAEIKRRVTDGEVFERPDGKTLVIETRTYERLSKSSVLDAYGKKKGEKMLDELRKAGALREEPRDELRAK